MRNKLGLIIPYRNRPDHLDEFVFKTKDYLNEKGIFHELIIVDQDNAKQFNRGMLLNIGFQYAEKLKCNYVVFHDVDMIPIEVDYSYSDYPLHMATDFVINEGDKKRETFDQYFGGVTLFPSEDFKKIDGYSNKYWGWGYEDDDLLHRCIKHGIKLDTLKIKNVPSNNVALKFNGINSYVTADNKFRTGSNITFFVTFYPDDIICDHTKEKDEFNVFTIPGYDFSIAYNSFSRYNFTTFDKNKKILYVNSEIKTNYKTNICVVIDNINKILKVYQDGKILGVIEDFGRLYSYTQSKKFYLGASNPNNSNDPKYYKGYIFRLVVWNDVLSDEEVFEISNNTQNKKITENFGNYKSADYIDLYYDAKHIYDYKLRDLSGNQNHGEINNCEIVEINVDEYKEVHVPFRRNSLFQSLKHEENGFVENNWKEHPIRWNQMRFVNEIWKNEDLIMNDGLSTLEFIEHHKTRKDRITYISVGI